VLLTILWLSAGATVLGLLSNWLHQYLLRTQTAAPEVRPDPAVSLPGPLRPAGTPPTQVASPNYAPEERPGFWFRRLLSPFLCLGILGLAVQPVVLWVNTYLLCRTLEIVYDVTPEPMAHLRIWQLDRELSVFDAWALTVSLGQMLLAAIALHPRVSKESSVNLLTRLALGGWLSLAGYEILASVYRAWVGGESIPQAMLGGLAATGIVILEAASGALVFEFLLAPLLMAPLWSVAALVRAGFRWVGGLSFTAPVLTSAPRRPIWRSLLEAIDELFQPLRDLDRAIYDRILARLTPRSVSTRVIALLLLGLLLLHPISALAQISAPIPMQPIDWYAGIDDSWSVTKEQLDLYKGEMFQKVVLMHLRARDTLFLFTIGARPEDHHEFLDLTAGRIHSSVLDFYRRKVAPLPPAPARGSTDLGAPIEFVRQTVANRRDGPRQALPVAVIFTDGEPTGPQTAIGKGLPGNARLIFCGVLNRHEAALRALLKRAKVADGQVEIVMLAGWQAWINGFSARLNRAPDIVLVQKLHSQSR
jgi:hypothetical protein